MKPVITVAVLMALLISQLGYAQNDTPMEVLVNIANENTRFIPQPIFAYDDRNTDYLDDHLEAYFPLRLNKEILDRILEEGPEAIALQLPYKDGGISVKLINHDVRSSDFEIIDLNNSLSIPTPAAQFYRGIVENKRDAVAGVSFFEGEIYGVFSTSSQGNIALIPDPIFPGDGEHYILYAQTDVKKRAEFSCDADAHNKIEDYLPSASRSNVYSTCEDIEVYIEATYGLYQNRGSASATSNYISAFFNNTAVIFRNEGIYTSLSRVGINTSEDGFSNLGTPLEKLNAFGEKTKNNHKQYGAEVAHLVDYEAGWNIRGLAWINSMCYNYSYYSSQDLHWGGYALSNVVTDDAKFDDFPSAVFVFAHEMGHQLGSQHTQWCLWEGGPIDNCASVENGPCTAGPTPTNGGTIMSYCFDDPEIGINFSEGFGPLPGNLIRTRISQKTCQAEYIPSRTVPSDPLTTVIANRECTDEQGWTNYYFDNNTSDEDDDELILSVQKGNEDIGNLDDGTLQVKLMTSSNAGSGSTAITNAGYTASDDWHVMNRWFELDPTEEPMNPVTVRFPYTGDDFVDVLLNQPMVTKHQDLIFYKIDSPADPNPDNGHVSVTDDDIHFYINDEQASLNTWKYVKSGSKHFAEFQVTSFSGGGGGFTQNTQSALPVNLLDFEASGENEYVKLKWSTSSEINNDFFTVERSIDGVDYQAIGKIQGAGTVSSESIYEFLDRAPATGINYYKLSQTDFDGTQKELGVRTVKIDGIRDVKIFPNPIHSSLLSLDLNAEKHEDLDLEILSIDGKLIYKQALSLEKGSNVISIELPEMKSGIYMVNIVSNYTSHITKLIKD